MPLSRPRRGKLLIALAALAIIVLAVVSKPALHLLGVSWLDANDLRPLPSGYLDDASRLNPTRVAKVWQPPNETAAAERQLARLLRRAGKEGRRISIAGARHTMGGHTITMDGLVLDMLPFNRMSLDEQRNFLTVQAGARWAEVIPLLDRHGRSVAVMQSNNSFSVGGSISVNCHGWQYGMPPIASTVESFRIMLADGSIKRCSRDDNAELFSLALGGYGLFGVILDANLRVVPNQRVRLEQFIVPVVDALATFDQHVAGREDVTLAYGRLGIAPTRFLQDAVINVLYEDPAADGILPPLVAAESTKLRRSMFRGSVCSDYGKELRWTAEARLQPHLHRRHFSRNQLLNEGVEVFQNRSVRSTDILHEYFVPRDGLPRFIDAVRRIVLAHDADLLNVTVRYVEEDVDTFLRYADASVFALVMLFNQSRTVASDARMETMTRELIDAANDAGGRYYLPYRLHATQEQFDRAYPQAEEFFELKRKYDPLELFQNQFYLKYGKTPSEPP